MSTTTDRESETQQPPPKPTYELDHAAVRFAGDSGDGMQLAGTQLTNTSAVFGNDVATLPDYPAEIRAPAGTLPGVSAFQVQFSDHDIYTPGDRIDALIAMNPAALKVHLPDLVEGGVLIVNVDEFTDRNCQRVGFETNPLSEDSDLLKNYRVYKVPITRHTLEAVKDTGLGTKDAGRCKNFYALGLVYWLYDRPLEPTIRWIEKHFANKPQVAEANLKALRAGYHFGETAEIFPVRYKVRRARLAPGTYRNLTGNQAVALGLVTAGQLAGKPVVYASYPITPASDILHELARYKNYDVRTLQAEDEIAAVCAAIGAGYAGAIGVTASSGPGIALKQEAIGLAVMTELPVVIINVQRAGPSTGMPTKPEQADFFQALVGRHGESPVPVVAPATPSDCFDTVLEAVRVAVRFMTPVIVLSDGYLANSSEPWRIPKVADLEPIRIEHARDPASFKPYARDARGVRPWAIPGTPGLEHRIGGLEKEDITGNVSYDPENHQKMVRLRATKVESVADEIAPAQVFGPRPGELLLVSWGGTFGAVRTAAEQLQSSGRKVAHLHLRWLHPLPRNVGEILADYPQVLACEMNCGQLAAWLRGRFLIDIATLCKVKGRPFTVHEIVEKVEQMLGGAP